MKIMVSGLTRVNVSSRDHKNFKRNGTTRTRYKNCNSIINQMGSVFFSRKLYLIRHRSKDENDMERTRTTRGYNMATHIVLQS